MIFGFVLKLVLKMALVIPTPQEKEVPEFGYCPLSPSTSQIQPENPTLPPH
jgi:hypothetical protein